MERAPFQPGETIGGRYEVQKILRGGFGLVYICRQIGPEQYARSGNMVALKTPLPRHLATAELRGMFLAEAAHCVALGSHPNLVLAYGVEEHCPESRGAAGELRHHRRDVDALAHRDPGVEIGHHRDRRVAHAELPGEDSLGVPRHIHEQPALAGEEPRLGPRREARAAVPGPLVRHD